MGFVRDVTTDLSVPHEPGNTITIRRPRRKLLQEAANKRQADALGRVRELGGPAFFAELRGLSTADVATQATPQPVDQYDQDELLRIGVVAWHGPLYDDVEVNAESLADLDPTTATWLADAIARFATGDAERKNA